MKINKETGACNISVAGPAGAFGSVKVKEA
jgi:hypothetical protein